MTSKKDQPYTPQIIRPNKRWHYEALWQNITNCRLKITWITWITWIPWQVTFIYTLLCAFSSQSMVDEPRMNILIFWSATCRPRDQRVKSNGRTFWSATFVSCWQLTDSRSPPLSFPLPSSFILHTLHSAHSVRQLCSLHVAMPSKSDHIDCRYNSSTDNAS